MTRNSTPEVVLAAGMPRSGTVLVANIVRELFERRGHAVAVLNPIGSLLDAIEQAVDDPAITILHCHSWGPACDALLEGRFAPGVISVRDPRDAAVSWARLMGRSPIEAAERLASYPTSHAAFMARDDRVEVRYEDHMRDRRGHIERIGSHVGLSVDDGLVDAVLSATSVEAHRRMMAAAASGTADEVEARPGPFATIREHMPTMITERHIQSGAAGRWRRELSPAVQGWVNARLRPARTALGYE